MEGISLIRVFPKLNIHEMKLNPLTLSFPKRLEETFFQIYSQDSVKQLRWAFLLAIGFYSIFGVLDATLMPDHKSIIWFIRFGIVCPVIFIGFLISYTRLFLKYWQVIMSLLMIVSGGGIVVMTVIAPPPANFSYYAGIILVFIFGYGFVRLRFVWATLGGWITVLLYEIAAIAITETPFPILLNNNFFFISANLIGMFVCYAIEYYAKRDFYMARLLEKEREKVEELNLKLEKRVQERTRQLSISNKELKEREQRLRFITDLSFEGIVLHDDGNVVDCNQTYAHMFGFSTVDECVGRSVFEFTAPESHEILKHHIQSKSQEPYEIICMRNDGSSFIGEVYVRNVKYNGHRRRYESIRDVTDRKKTQQKLRESEEKYREVVERANDGIVIIQDGIIEYANSRVVEMLGFSMKKIIGAHFNELAPKEEQSRILRRYRKRMEGRRLKPTFQSYLYKKNGDKIFVEYNGGLINYQGNPADLVVIRDITERKKGEEKIKASLKEKDILLQEIHHRVKNNLQIISSLLTLQSRYIEDEFAYTMFKESLDRVRSMAMVHDELYQSNDFTNVDFQDYIQTLILSLYKSYQCNINDFELVIDTQKIQLGLDQAIPCGLIINELLSNILRHAFPNGWIKKKKIVLNLKEKKGGVFHLVIEDNGIGLPKDIQINAVDSLGLQLVFILAVDQLNGRIKMNRENGTRFEIQFTKV